MKKIVITVFAVTAAAVAVQAEGVARDVNTFPQYAPTFGTSNVSVSDSARQNDQFLRKLGEAMAAFDDEAQRQHIAYLRAQQKKAAAQKTQAAQPEANATPADQAKPAQTPYYYYGREGKMLALADKTAEVVNGNSSAATSAQTQTQTQPQTQPPAKKAERKKGSILGYLGIGPLPGESWGSYNERTRYAASQPFK